MVGVAQLVERRLVVADVAGSSPVTHPNHNGPLACGDADQGLVVEGEPFGEGCLLPGEVSGV
jgi:hypothetical protein